MKTIFTSCLVLASFGLLVACSESGDGSGATSSTGASAAPTWLLASAPENPSGVTSLKESANEGDEVVMRGVIGGRIDALSETSAVFVLIDESVHNPCTDNEDDHCPTPWDYCCSAPAELIANNATVQLVDNAGAPLAIDLRQHGIEPLDHVIVIGTVAARPTPQVLTVKAKAIYREQS